MMRLHREGTHDHELLVVFLSKILQRLNVRDDPPLSILTNSIPFLKTQPPCMLSQSCGGTGYND